MYSGRVSGFLGKVEGYLLPYFSRKSSAARSRASVSLTNEPERPKELDWTALRWAAASASEAERGGGTGAGGVDGRDPHDEFELGLLGQLGPLDELGLLGLLRGVEGMRNEPEPELDRPEVPEPHPPRLDEPNEPLLPRPAQAGSGTSRANSRATTTRRVGAGVLMAGLLRPRSPACPGSRRWPPPRRGGRHRAKR